MSANSPIEWTDHTFNPWWGCSRVSPGCENCYAEALSVRYGHRVWGPAKTTSRRLFGEQHWQEPFKWNAAAEQQGVRRRVFCASMADVFEKHPDIEQHRASLWSLIERTTMLDWLLLTKRPENIRAMIPRKWLQSPQPNVWFGTSVEDKRRAQERISVLADVPATVRFLSCEPLLESLPELPLTGIHWLIVGGESGPGARAMRREWALDILMQCRRSGVAFFFKQTGTVLAASLGIYGKGGHDLSGVPSSLQVREFPVISKPKSRATRPAVRLAS
jgi:protein gp37